MSGKLYHGLNPAAGASGALSLLSNFRDINSLNGESRRTVLHVGNIP